MSLPMIRPARPDEYDELARVWMESWAVRLFKIVPSRQSFDAYLARCIARPAFQRAEKLAAG